MYRNQKNIVMTHSKSKFRVLAVHSDGSHTFFYRPTLQSSIKFVRECFIKLYPTYGSVTYYIQEYRKSLNDYVSFLTCDYYYFDLPF